MSVAIIATDVVAMFGYTRDMPKRPQPPRNDLKPINRWVVDALDFSGMSQADLANELAARKVITSKDRSFVNKMTLGKRGVSFEEAMAISKITNFPPLDPAGDPDRLEAMAIYDELPEPWRRVYLQQVRDLARGVQSQPPDAPALPKDEK